MGRHDGEGASGRRRKAGAATVNGARRVFFPADRHDPTPSTVPGMNGNGEACGEDPETGRTELLLIHNAQCAI
jgi:hypothetical protein